MKKAVILLSGGLDSATVLAHAIAEGYACYALSFAYGQRHGIELLSAQKVAQALGATEHKIAEIDLRLFGGSALTSDTLVPKVASVADIGTEIPVTYVPARNTIFLSHALAWAEVLGAYDIFIGVNAVDYSGYPDCRPAFIHAFEAMANLATAYALKGDCNGAEQSEAQSGGGCGGKTSDQRITIHTPLIDKTKADIIRMGLALGVDYSMTISCYDPDEHGNPCGQCHSCHLRAKGFADVMAS